MTAPELSLIAPDLRGRGDSVGVTGASSTGRHAADMVAVLDSLGLESVHVCGMSMGGFVAVELAACYPERVRSLILVDGGPPMPTPPGLTPEDLPKAFRDRLARLDREFPSVAAYAKFFVATTGPLLDPADPLLLDYLAHDLSGRRVRLKRRGPDRGLSRRVLRHVEMAAADDAHQAARGAVGPERERRTCL